MTQATTATNQESAGEHAPGDRATTFQPVTGPQAEHYSGEVLLVSAYAILWVILFSWIALLWRKSSRLDSRLDELERVIDRAAAAKDAP
jgi:CcmD family protein